MSKPFAPDTLSEHVLKMSAKELSALNVVLGCLLCDRYRECETARQLVQDPLLLVDRDQEGRR